MDYFAAMAATWPAETERLGPWTLRRGGGGGNRVSAATLEGTGGRVAEAEAAMRARGQRPLFMIRPGEDALDAELAARGYELKDRTTVLAAAVGDLAKDGADWGVVRCDGVLARMAEIWDEAGIGAARRAVMMRARGPKVWLLARDGDRPAGAAFVAVAGEVAMLHALSIAPTARRKGLGARMTRGAAGWARGFGAREFALAVTDANVGAMALYAGMGMREVARYHYREERA